MALREKQRSRVGYTVEDVWRGQGDEVAPSRLVSMATGIKPSVIMPVKTQNVRPCGQQLWGVGRDGRSARIRTWRCYEDYRKERGVEA